MRRKGCVCFFLIWTWNCIFIQPTNENPCYQAARRYLVFDRFLYFRFCVYHLFFTASHMGERVMWCSHVMIQTSASKWEATKTRAATWCGATPVFTEHTFQELYILFDKYLPLVWQLIMKWNPLLSVLPPALNLQVKLQGCVIVSLQTAGGWHTLWIFRKPANSTVWHCLHYIRGSCLKQCI